MKHKYKKLILIFLLLFIFAVNLNAKSLPMQNRMGIGLNYPGVSVRYWFDKFCYELKGQFGEGIQLYGLRIYKRFNSILYIGVEGDYISFKGEEAKGIGMATEIFLGGEVMIDNRLSLNLDIGPSYIFLADRDTSETIGGFDIIGNIGINYYFGR